MRLAVHHCCEPCDADHPRYFRAYRIFFYSFDCSEPEHVHVSRERKVCKFWLEPVALAYNNGFSAKELNRIRRTIVDHLDRIVEAWDEHCGDR